MIYYLRSWSPLHTVIVHRLLGCAAPDGSPSPCTVELVQAVDFRVPSAPRRLRAFVVPAGFRYDRATMPLAARALVDRDRLDPAALAHDWALSVRYDWALSRRDCDRLFLNVALLTPGLSRWRARLAYLAVRIASLIG